MSAIVRAFLLANSASIVGCLLAWHLIIKRDLNKVLQRYLDEANEAFTKHAAEAIKASVEATMAVAELEHKLAIFTGSPLFRRSQDAPPTVH